MSKHGNHNHESSGSSGRGTGEVRGNTQGNSPGVSPNDGVSAEQQESGETAREGNVPDTPEKKTEAPEAESAALKIPELEAKLADLNDQYLRKAADFENFRKRMIREKQEITDFANQNLLLDLLPVIDDFERAIKSAQSSPAAQTSKDFTSFYNGIVMIEKRFSGVLENKWGLKRFDSEGQPFDPNRHEAIQMEKAAGIAEAVVTDDFVKGYYLKEKVIRYAKVKVLMPADGASAAAQPAAAGEPGVPGLDREK